MVIQYDNFMKLKKYYIPQCVWLIGGFHNSETQFKMYRSYMVDSVVLTRKVRKYLNTETNSNYNNDIRQMTFKFILPSISSHKSSSKTL